jgi:hypothetical protein
VGGGGPPIMSNCVLCLTMSRDAFILWNCLLFRQASHDPDVVQALSMF